MATAMEKMVAGMLGITPEEMGAMMTGFQDLLKNLAATLAEIKAQGEANNALLTSILEKVESNGNRGSKPRRSGDSGSGPGNGSPEAGGGSPND